MFLNIALPVLLSFVVAVSSLATPHIARHPNHHAIAARVAALDPVQPPVLHRKRANGQRCRPRATPSIAPSVSLPTSTHKVTTQPSPTSERKADATTTHQAPTSTYHPPPATTSAYVPPPTTQKASPPATTSASSGGSDSYLYGIQSGDGTWYQTGLGACGITNNNSDLIAAASMLLFDTYPGYDGVDPNNNPICGKQVQATYQGVSVVVTITDRCTGCSLTSLDFSPKAFDTLTNNDPGLGRIDITWKWL